MKIKIGNICKFTWYNVSYCCYFRVTRIHKDEIHGIAIYDNQPYIDGNWPVKRGAKVWVWRKDIEKISDNNFDTIEEFLMCEEL